MHMKAATESSEALSPESIRAELDKILASPGFATAERLSRFLRHVVEGTLDGQNDRLKESVLGIEVFGRKASYDPRMDAVVRTEAVKLRSRLKEYYDTEGHADPVRIDLPKGGYIPAFRVHEETPQQPPEHNLSTEAPVVEPAPPSTWKVLAAVAGTVVVLA